MTDSSNQNLVERASIIESFQTLQERLFKTTDLEWILRKLKKERKISRRTTLEQVADILAEESILQSIDLMFPNENVVRFFRDGVSPYEIALTLRTSCFLSHLSALYVNNLLEKVPKSIYINSEQKPKPPILTPISQQSIDIAFRNPQRTTNNIATLGNREIHILNGMYSGQLGVTTVNHKEGLNLCVTGVERTLIDSVVRPTYSGGPATILEAFHIAGTKRICSPQTILALLAKLNFRYPYLQAIGFYMERSGQYSDHLQMIYEKCALQFDFYISHNEADLEYSSRWKIYFPKWLKIY